MKAIKSICMVLVMALATTFANAQQAASKNSIDKITNAYLAVKNALATGNSTTTEAKAKELFETLSADPGKGLKPDQQKTLNTYLEKLKFDSRHISESSSIDHQREHFESLSKNLYDVLKGLKLNTTTIYQQYCPMKKAYWLSESSTIKNPYYNDKEMSTCGKNTSTLTAVK
jgi:hypothetical protein